MRTPSWPGPTSAVGTRRARTSVNWSVVLAPSTSQPRPIQRPSPEGTMGFHAAQDAILASTPQAPDLLSPPHLRAFCAAATSRSGGAGGAAAVAAGGGEAAAEAEA